MEKQALINSIPYIYHLTDRNNLRFVKTEGVLYSTLTLIERSTTLNKDELSTIRRDGHTVLNVNGVKVSIRDQRPLNAALNKCLEGNCTREDYIRLLNSRVFFWATLERLQIHFKRYEDENPIILRIETVVALELNPHVQLCRLNSGATRPSHHLGGKAPSRGFDTFKTLDDFNLPASQIVEITFPERFVLPDSFHISKSPFGTWRQITIRT